MARVGYIPYDPVREQETEDWKRERRAMKRPGAEFTEWREADDRFGFLDPNDDEFESVDALAEFLIEDDREQYTHQELQCVYYRTSRPLREIKAALADWGLSLQRRDFEHTPRGITAWDHNRWQGCR